MSGFQLSNHWVIVRDYKLNSIVLNEKAKTYICTFFNGDLKVFNKHDHSEILSVKNLHEDAIISDSLFLKNNNLQKKIIVTCS